VLGSLTISELWPNTLSTQVAFVVDDLGLAPQSPGCISAYSDAIESIFHDRSLGPCSLICLLVGLRGAEKAWPLRKISRDRTDVTRCFERFDKSF
jgi:hypothetical protein